MHDSAHRIGTKFLNLYWRKDMSKILELGSANINGGLRDSKPKNATWVGVDLSPGEGVDVVLEPKQELPFEDNSFDLVVASSVFEHDVQFWETLSEMARVASDQGFIYISAPSNGAFHRHPYDVFRFYPDAGVSFLEIVKKHKPLAVLAESFIASRDVEGWLDFAVVISCAGEAPQHFIFESEVVTNLWKMSEFQTDTLRIHSETNDSASMEVSSAIRFNKELLNSKSWRYTAPFRYISGLLERAVQKVNERISS